MCLKKELFHICISEKGPFRQIFEFHIDCAVTVVDGHHRIGLILWPQTSKQSSSSSESDQSILPATA